MNMNSALINPPKKIWPFLHEDDNFRPPLGLASLAGSLRDNKIDLSVIDCCASKIGWKSLRKILLKEKPKIVCAGDMTYYAKEIIQLSRLVKCIIHRRRSALQLLY